MLYIGIDLGTSSVKLLLMDAAGNVKGLHIFGEVTLSYPSIIEIILILAAAFLSFKTTDKKRRCRG